MERFTINSKSGKVIINQISDDEVEVHQESKIGCSCVLKLTSSEMEKVAKALFKMNKQLESSNAALQQTKPTNMPIPSIPQEATVSRMAMTQSMHPQAYAKWTVEEEERLKRFYQEGKGIKEIAFLMNRNEGGIRSRLRKLGLMNY